PAQRAPAAGVDLGPKGTAGVQPGTGQETSKSEISSLLYGLRNSQPGDPTTSGHAPLRPNSFSVVGSRAEGARNRTLALRILSHRQQRSPARVHRYALCRAGQ